MAKKITIAERLRAIALAVENGDAVSKEDIAFLRERADMSEKKTSNRKPTKTQTENEVVKAEILEGMENGKAYTISEIQAMVGLSSNQKTSALVRQLKDNGLVERSEVKGKAYFTKVCD